MIADDTEAVLHPEVQAELEQLSYSLRGAATDLERLQVMQDTAAALWPYRTPELVRDLTDVATQFTKWPPETVENMIVSGFERARLAKEWRDANPAPPRPGNGIAQGPAGLYEKLEPDEPIEPLEMFDAGDWEDKPTEPRLWTTLDQIPAGEPGILSGDGGTGKTMIAMQLGCSVGAEWQDWLGKIVDTHGPVIFYSVEEKLTELHRRVSWILESRNASFSKLRKRFFLIADRKDETILGRAERNGLVVPTRTLLRLEKSVALVRPALVVIENAADVFAGNENDRAQVHPFVRGLLGGLCTINGATMMLLQHPSVSGLIDRTGRSGSTGWNNAGRWRLNFTEAKEDDEDDGIDNGRRQLVTMKNNYGRRGEKISVEWRDGIFVPKGSQSAPHQAAAEASLDEAFMRCLDAATAQGRTVSDSTGRNYAPALFEKMTEAKGTKKRAFELAMERLFTASKIKIQTEGKGKHAKKCLLRT
jgi:RecA-family ATPase